MSFECFLFSLPTKIKSIWNSLLPDLNVIFLLSVFLTTCLPHIILFRRKSLVAFFLPHFSYLFRFLHDHWTPSKPSISSPTCPLKSTSPNTTSLGFCSSYSPAKISTESMPLLTSNLSFKTWVVSRRKSLSQFCNLVQNYALKMVIILAVNYQNC